MTEPATILWRRLDQPGHESVRVRPMGDGGWDLSGVAVFDEEGQPCRLDYRILCDSAWHTRTAEVHGWVGARDIAIRIEAGDGRWLLNGEPCPRVDGCIDVDLNFSPCTNLLPIRRLDLAIGERAEVRAAWLRFPGFTLEPLPQVYHRTGERAYHYESAGGSFTSDLEVTAAGLVLNYAGLWQAIAGDAVPPHRTPAAVEERSADLSESA